MSTTNNTDASQCASCGNQYFHTIECRHWIKRHNVATRVTDDQRVGPLPKKARTKLVQDFHSEDDERIEGIEL